MSTDASVTAGVLSIAAFVIFVTAWWLIDRHDTAVVERMLRADFKAHMDAYQPDPWDGDTWDWPEGHLAEYFFGQDTGYPVLAASDLPPQTDPGHTTATDRVTPDHPPASATSHTFSPQLTGRAETFPAERPTDTYLASQPTSPAAPTLATRQAVSSRPISSRLRQARALASRVTRQADLRPSEPVRRTDSSPSDPSSADVPNRTGPIQAPPSDGTDLPGSFSGEPAPYPSCPLPPGHPGRLADSTLHRPADALIRHGSATDMPLLTIPSRPADIPYSLVPLCPDTPYGKPALSHPGPGDIPYPCGPYPGDTPYSGHADEPLRTRFSRADYPALSYPSPADMPSISDPPPPADMPWLSVPVHADMPAHAQTQPADMPQLPALHLPADMPGLSAPVHVDELIRTSSSLVGYPTPTRAGPADIPSQAALATTEPSHTESPDSPDLAGPSGVTDTDLFIMMLREKAGQFIEQKITGASRYASSLA